MNTSIQTTLSTLDASLTTLITTLTTSPTAATAPPAALALLTADDNLTSAVETLRRHQSNYARILKLRDEAQELEERVRGVVREVVGFERVVGGFCGDGSEDESESEDEGEDGDGDYDMSATRAQAQARRQALRMTKEVDYKLLLDFARRISKYNHQAAADAAEGKTSGGKTKRLEGREQDSEMGGMNGTTTTTNTTTGTGTADADAEPVATVTKDATSWLDESAHITRQAYMLPYPMEDRIRMGLMGQIQLAGAEGRADFDPDREVERLIREAEGFGTAETVAPAVVAEETRADEAARAAANAGSAAASAVRSAPKPKPKATLDLDLYDPDEDDM